MASCFARKLTILRVLSTCRVADDAQLMSFQAGARLGIHHNRIHELRHFHLIGAPAKLDMRRDSIGCQPAFGQPDILRGEAFALQVFYGLNFGLCRNRENYTDRVAGYLGVGQLTDLDHIYAVVLDPVTARQTRINHAIF